MLRASAARKLTCMLVLATGCATTAPPPKEPAKPVEPPPPPWEATPPPAPLAATEPSFAKQHTMRLPNGLNVIVVQRPQRPLVQIRLVLPRGYTSDPKKAPGATYLAVKLLGDYHEVDSEGRRKRREKSLRRQVIEIGGSYGGYVGADSSVLTIDGYAKDLTQYFDILMDAILTPRCGSISFNGRRDALIGMLEDIDPSGDDVFFRALSSSIFGKRHPYSRSPYGTIKTLDKMRVQQVERHQEALLSPTGATLIVTGAVKARQVQRAAIESLGPWRPSPRKLKAPRMRAPKIG